MMEDLKNIIESLLFVAEAPLTIERFREITAAEAADIREVLTTLMGEYETRKGGFLLREVAGGFQIRTRPEYTEWIRLLLQPTPPRFSRAWTAWKLALPGSSSPAPLASWARVCCSRSC